MSPAAVGLQEPVTLGAKGSVDASSAIILVACTESLPGLSHSEPGLVSVHTSPSLTDCADFENEPIFAWEV